MAGRSAKQVPLLLIVWVALGCALINRPGVDRQPPIVTSVEVPEVADSVWAVAKASEAMTRAYKGRIPFKAVEFEAVSGGYLVFVSPIQSPDRVFLDAGGRVWVGLNGYVVVLSKGG